MIRRRTGMSNSMNANILIAASMLLLGVLIMAYGFFQQNLQATYVGIGITGIAELGNASDCVYGSSQAPPD